MEITHEMVQAYAGMQVRIHDLRNDSSVQGPIYSASIENGELIINFEWTARKDNGSADWVNHHVGILRRDMKGHTAKDVGVTNPQYKLSFSLPDVFEHVTFLPSRHLTNLRREQIIDEPSVPFANVE